MNKAVADAKPPAGSPLIHPRWEQAIVSAQTAGLDDSAAQTVRNALQQTADDLSPLQLQLLEETFESLAKLNTESDLALTALLFEHPALQSAIKPSKAQETLFIGQRSAQQVWELHDPDSSQRNSEGLRSLLLALVKDLRVILVLLARQLARMRLLDQYDAADRDRIVHLTRDIHAPLANRLGIWQLKWELEDRLLRATQPETYKRIAKLLDEKRVDRESFIREVTATLEQSLQQHDIQAQVLGRPKHIYSIWKKMTRKDAPIGELYDLRAVRILVPDITACYTALGVVHQLWMPIPSEFDDYIARPKRNDYRSLHTAVVGPQGKTLEVQIRTFEMHEKAELGVAAHWRYKEGSGNNAALDRKIAWMRNLLEQAPDELNDELRNELDEDRIFVLTPKGEVVDLPVGGTPLDFAYHVHTEVGHRTRGAKVNGVIVNLDRALQTGDRVDIMTGKVSEPRRDWLIATNGFLKSPRSRGKVRSWFNKLDRERNLQEGKELLDKELRRVGLLNADLKPILSKFNVSTDDELQVLVALGDVGTSQIARALQELEKPQAAPGEVEGAELLKRLAKPSAPGDSSAPFVVGGVGNLLMQIAKCCQPVRGEPIVGYLTKGRGISVHRPDCGSLLRLQSLHPERVLGVEWGGKGEMKQEVDIQIDAMDRRFLLKDITDTVAASDTHVLAVRSDRTPRTGAFRITLTLRVRDYEQLSVVLAKLASLQGVQNAFRR